MADKTGVAEHAHTAMVLCGMAIVLVEAISRESKDAATKRTVETIVKKLREEQERQERRYKAAKNKTAP